jgi:hypothetical protein
MLVIEATILIAIAIAWPLANLGPRSRPLLTLGHGHGIERTDVLALMPLSLGLLFLGLVWDDLARKRRR